MAKKAAPKAAPAPAPAGRVKAMSRADLYAALSEKTGVSKKDVANIFNEMSDLVLRELGKKGPGAFAIPGLIKLRVVRKPATKAKQGINPFTKEPQMFKAKPARNVVKATPLKALKDAV